MTVSNELVAAHADAVWRIAYRLLSNHADALDCYQETFMDAMRLDGSAVRNWRATLCSIAARRAIDQLRRRYRDQKVQPLADYESASEERPEQRASTDEFREQVRLALTTLPPQQAEAFWLRHIEQLDSNEVAEQMNIQPGNVRVLVHRAAEQLRQFLSATYAAEAGDGDSQ
jgi:RNA polymerase sigma-70 factor (ECF subfamily)